MPDDTQNGNSEVQQAAPQQVENEQPQKMPTETKSTEGDLASDASEKTRQQFEKLKRHNKELKEKLSKFEESSDVFGAYTKMQSPKYQQPVSATNDVISPKPAKVEKEMRKFVDDEGNVDIDLLNQTLTAAEKRALEADKRAAEAQRRVEEFEITYQAREMYKEFPELNPKSNNFNPEYFDIVKKDLLAQLVETGRQDGMKAAKKYIKYFRESPKKKEIEAQKVNRENASLSLSQSGKGRSYSAVEDAELRKRSRTESAALWERLKRSGY